MDLTNTPKAAVVLKEFGFQTGALIDQRFALMDVDRQNKLDEAISTLNGEDTRISAILTQIQRIADAQPGTAEFDEGQNLYTLMQNNYLALDDRITANANLATALNTWKATFINDYTSTIGRIDQSVAAETQTRQTEVARLEGLINSNNEMIGLANAARVALKSQLENTDASQTDEINALKNRMGLAEESIATYGENIATLQGQMQTRMTEIAGLQGQHNDLTARVVLLENMWDGFNSEGAVAEFAAGLGGQVSPGGYQPYAPA